ncbi:MAG: hypothetical protein JNL70_19205 [Saprospiraceae bacterium]|nr:hypothetical protein [Saprospiraceae bacterium]
MKNHTLNRRHFLKKASILTTSISLLDNAFSFLPLPLHANRAKGKAVKIGWITDVHHGYCTDAQKRLETFIHEANGKKLDFILQGGDFCHPTAESKPFLDVWNSFKGEKYHVLGNHDMDKGTKQQIMDMWGMKEKYYSFDKGDFHFIVLDCNYILKDGQYLDYAHGNFYISQKNRDHIHPEQIEWLKNDLATTNKQCIIISHQSIDEIWGGYGVSNRLDVRKVIDDANNRADFQKVVACFCGHHHVDDHSYINKVHYFQMNSASYYYVGEGFGSDGAKAMYKDPLFAFVTIDPSGKIAIEGRQSQFVSPTPMEKKYRDAARISAVISDRKERFR